MKAEKILSKINKNTEILDIKEKAIERELILNNWPKLKQINCSVNKLKKLTITNCPNLRIVYAWNNLMSEIKIENCPFINVLRIETNNLTNLTFLNKLESSSLIDLRITNNKSLPYKKLEDFIQHIEHFANLRNLGICGNELYGTLEPLKVFKNIKIIDARDNGFTTGLEYLPDDLEKIYCLPSDNLVRFELKECQISGLKTHFCYKEWKRKNQLLINSSKLNWKENIYPFKGFNHPLSKLWFLNGFDKSSTHGWLEVGLKPEDFDFAEWMKKKGISPDYFMENLDYDSERDKWIESQHGGEKMEMSIPVIRTQGGKKIEVWDTSQLRGDDFEKGLRKDQIRIELFKKLDKGKKIRTKIVKVDEIPELNAVKFIIEGKCTFRSWTGDESIVSLLVENNPPYNQFKVGDLIEIDLGRLNSEKYTFEVIKSNDLEIIKLIESRQQIDEGNEINKLEAENQRLTEELKKKNEIIERITKENKELWSENSANILDNTSRLFI
jgi:hypothetical protein